MKLVRLGAAVLNQTPLDWSGNAANITGAIAEAKSLGVSVLCLPELCITGYGCEDLFLSPGFRKTAWDVLSEIVPYTKGMVVSLGLPLFYRNALFNTVCLAVDGRIAGFAAKRNLASEGIHYEPRWFKPWPEGMVGEVEVGGRTVPIGDLVFDCGGMKLGFEICEDAWAARRPGGDLAARGVDVILNPSASHFAFGKMDVRRRFVVEGSRAFGVAYVYSNLVGNEAGRAVYDGGAMIAADGRMIAQGDRFSFRDYALVSAVVDLELTRMRRIHPVSFSPVFDPDDRRQVRAPFFLPPVEPDSLGQGLFEETDLLEQGARWELSQHRKEEEFTRAVTLALYDYLRKSGTAGFVISLSGGADSTAVACLVHLMVRLGVSELGLQTFAGKLHARLRSVAEDGDAGELFRRLLVCVYQGTENSSDTTRNAARTVAERLGCEFMQWEVSEVVDAYRHIVEKAEERRLDWDRDGMALQNIQARCRAPGIWLLANIRNALLLSTSNRSEAAVGYATMDGDTCGGLSPIAGIDKNFLLRWLKWLEGEGPEGLGPMPFLSCVTVQKPTAELKPPEQGQTDEDDLMPYDVLDAIERTAIRDKKSPLVCWKLMKARFPAYDRARLALWVERFFRLWARNQWKRERYAPSFHLDDENLDPKTWCRFPILSGGYERELAELRSASGEAGTPEVVETLQ